MMANEQSISLRCLCLSRSKLAITSFYPVTFRDLNKESEKIVVLTDDDHDIDDGVAVARVKRHASVPATNSAQAVNLK